MGKHIWRTACAVGLAVLAATGAWGKAEDKVEVAGMADFITYSQAPSDSPVLEAEPSGEFEVETGSLAEVANAQTLRPINAPPPAELESPFAADRTTENTVRVEYRNTMSQMVTGRLSYAYSQRRSSEYEEEALFPTPTVAPFPAADPELPGFKQFLDDTDEHKAANQAQGEELLQMVQEASGETTVVAEDLGVVPDYVAPTLAKLGLTGFRIPTLFREHDVRYSDAKQYPRLSLAQPATHDHPPLAAAWAECWQNIEAGKDVEGNRRELRLTMEFAGLNGSEPPREFTDELHEAFTRTVMQSPSWLVVFQITDVFGMTARFNTPSRSRKTARRPLNAAVDSHFVGATCTAGACRGTETCCTNGADDDHDGMPDAWETEHFGSPGTIDGDPAADPDQDGLSNSAEYVAGTDPRDASSTIRLEVSRLFGGVVRLECHSQSGRCYRLESTSDLATGVWKTVDELPGTGETLRFLDSAPVVDPSRFYRLRVFF